MDLQSLIPSPEKPLMQILKKEPILAVMILEEDTAEHTKSIRKQFKDLLTSEEWKAWSAFHKTQGHISYISSLFIRFPKIFPAAV